MVFSLIFPSEKNPVHNTMLSKLKYVCQARMKLACVFMCALALMCIVKPDGPPMLCKTDEIGEIVVNSRAGGNMYYGLHGVTKNTFEV